MLAAGFARRKPPWGTLRDRTSRAVTNGLSTFKM
jgi:hypothetical protein